MKMFRKYSCIALLMGLLFLGCNPTTKSVLCQPATKVTTDAGVTSTQTYFYDGGLLKSMQTVTGSGSYSTLYQYDTQGDLGKMIINMSGQTYTTSYTYDSKHYVVASLSTNSGDTIRTNYYYNENGQLTRRLTLQQLGAAVPDTLRYNYEYPDPLTRNPASITTITELDTTIVHYEYDDKINPERGLVLPTIQPYNNITRYVSDALTYTISYQYNSNGYPISAIQSNGVTRTWTYSCKEF
ncbi:MAG: hypothetical protein JNL40_05240 [Cyclobacteriaceae bacterium]|nr:hypothetical protein [Cyclobacteriaceae bacterium]